ncbi:MAG: PHB depolymerase family esterase, partial [Pseudomonadota bacterium]|nr:PHB depolymerase family esterase [Pseudomonadota bacterium]
DQHRDAGEPALIVGIVREVASTCRIDDRRVYVAGLSAGAAMAVVLGTAYPDVFAAVGAHSGLPYAAAHDMPSAFAAMHGGAPVAGVAANPRASRTALRTPTIVFHGDADHTVQARNGAAIVDAAAHGRAEETQLRMSAQENGHAAGRGYVRTVYTDAAEHPIVEHWVVRGAGHAWSGGSQKGSFTDPAGPDASAEMVRFFYRQQRRSLS